MQTYNETEFPYFVNTELEDSTVFHKKPEYPPSKRLSSDNTLENITKIPLYIDTLLINDKEPIYDRYNEMSIMPVSQKSIREQNLQATIKFHLKKIGTYELRINGIPIKSKFKFKNFQKGAIYSLDIYSHDKLIAVSPFTFLPILAITTGLILYNLRDSQGFSVIWRYLAWANQVLSVFTLWAVTIYLVQKMNNYWISFIPALFMTCVCVTYICISPEGFGLSHSLSYIVGCSAILISIVRFYAWKAKL